MIDINGMAHIVLTVSQFEKAKDFYSDLLPEFGMERVFSGDDFCYHVGARTAIGVQRGDETRKDERFDQSRVGLHHICLRARSREDVDKTAEKLKAMNAVIVRGPMEGTWAPGYYYIVFEDPDGIRLEVNYVPGQGLLKEDTEFDGGGNYR